MKYGRRAGLIVAFLFLGVATVAPAQGKITSPKEFFGHNIGDDYWLATYDQFAAYWRKLDAESDRMQLVEIGKTAEGRPQLMAIVTSPENFKRLDRYKEISRRLALADGLTESDARTLAKEGKAVVWIDGGLHATEVLGAHQLMETLYQLISRSDAETMRLLDDDIMLMAHANPDGMQLVSSWYMREEDPTKRNTSIPRLYQKYIGHDNNRDFYLSAQPETQNINHQLYWEWFPQIVYNHHQTGPAGTVLFAPPFRDPFNYNFDPLVPLGIDLVGAAMHSRFVAEGKPGATMRSGSSYSTWWNGGLRTTVYFHNMIGLLTETIGNPTPMRIPLVPANQLPRADLPMPIEPQEWHFRQSVDYSVTANYAVMDVASRYRETFLFNMWRMGMNSIERGKRDTWTITSSHVEDLQRIADQSRRDTAGAVQTAGGTTVVGTPTTAAAGQGVAPRPDRETPSANAALFGRVLRNPADRDPRAYILAANQSDFPTATKFVNALRHVGVTVQRATAPFTASGKSYPAGTYVVPMAQAFRPHVLDMFEPQDHPNDLLYPGGPPKRPYDNAGYTLAYQMGVKFDRPLEPVDCPCETITGLAAPAPGTVATVRGTSGFVLSPRQNDAFIVVNRLLKAGIPVSRLTAPLTTSGKTFTQGSFYVPSSAAATQIIQTGARTLGVNAEGITVRAPASAARVRAPRIALWDTYGGSMPSGWTRWLFEQYEFPYEIVYVSQLDSANLRAKYDVLVLVDGAIPAQGGRGGGFQRAFTPPPEYRQMTGRITAERTVPQLRRFLDEGGEIVTIGSSTQLGYMLGLPISNALVDRTNGTERVLTADKFYVPGSVLRVAVDTTAAIAAGSERNVDVMFDNSPVFRLNSDAAAKGVRSIAWFDTDRPLRSGWAWGQHYLDGGVAIAEASVGRGKLYLFGPEVLFRAQPHGTFKLFFNSLLD
jgi:zinc carboxypeptidase